MPYLNEIVCLINRNFTRFDKGEKQGLAYQVTRKGENNTEQLFPVVFTGNEPTYIGVDDAKSSIIYHRVLRSVYARSAASFEGRYRRTVFMQMVVYAQGLDMRPEQIESLVIGQFPETYQNEGLTGLTGVNSIQVIYTGSELNPVTVFGGEYRNVPYRIPPEDAYFSVQYTLDILFDKSCLENCERANVPQNLCDWIDISTGQQIYDCTNDAQKTALEELLCDVQPCGDITYNVYVNGALRSTEVLSGCVDQTINIYP